ncbi:hypothetical protein E2C01_061175 [Portunus trituberculatus]|uniref:Uncharacterized protein n=1 Tax=Portunus trituberculatus TaxID=210409 RepID=A0A5B7HBJ7_PORTR|nr:hypothetical protein [Portunus trituberculatus]
MQCCTSVPPAWSSWLSFVASQASPPGRGEHYEDRGTVVHHRTYCLRITQLDGMGCKGQPLVNPHPEVLVDFGLGLGQHYSVDAGLPGWVCHLHHHGPGILSYLEAQLLTLLTDSIEYLLCSPVLVAPASDNKGKVIGVARQGGVLGEELCNKLLPQQVEEEGAEDAALEHPQLDFRPRNLTLALEYCS